MPSIILFTYLSVVRWSTGIRQGSARIYNGSSSHIRSTLGIGPYVGSIGPLVLGGWWLDDRPTRLRTSVARAVGHTALADDGLASHAYKVYTSQKCGSCHLHAINPRDQSTLPILLGPPAVTCASFSYPDFHIGSRRSTPGHFLIDYQKKPITSVAAK